MRSEPPISPRRHTSHLARIHGKVSASARLRQKPTLEYLALRPALRAQASPRAPCRVWWRARGCSCADKSGRSTGWACRQHGWTARTSSSRGWLGAVSPMQRGGLGCQPTCLPCCLPTSRRTTRCYLPAVEVLAHGEVRRAGVDKVWTGRVDGQLHGLANEQLGRVGRGGANGASSSRGTVGGKAENSPRREHEAPVDRAASTMSRARWPSLTRALRSRRAVGTRRARGGAREGVERASAARPSEPYPRPSRPYPICLRSDGPAPSI